MNEKILEKAVLLSKQCLKLIATCNESGVPHIAAAGEIVQLNANQITLTEWFCPGTVSNAKPGREVSIVIWDPKDDIGHQLIGKIIRVEETAVCDGYLPKEEKEPQLPQTEYRLVVEIYKILEFCKKPHSDVEE